MSRKALAELKALKQKLFEARGRAARDAWDIGAHLVRIRRDKLWRAAGFESFTDFLTHGVDCSRASAYRYLRIAEHFDADVAESYGIDKLRLVLRLMAITPAEERPADIFSAQVRVRGKNGRYRSISVHEASAAQLDEGIQLREEQLSHRPRVRRSHQIRKGTKD